MSAHQADAADVTSDATPEEVMMASTTIKKKKGFRWLRFFVGGILPFMWVVALGLMLRVSGNWTGMVEIQFNLPGALAGYSFSTTHLLLTLYALIAVYECCRVSLPGVDQTKEVMIIVAFGIIQAIVAVVAAVILGMGGSNWFTLAFANSESIIYALITGTAAYMMFQINSHSLVRSFVDGTAG